MKTKKLSTQAKDKDEQKFCSIKWGKINVKKKSILSALSITYCLSFYIFIIWDISFISLLYFQIVASMLSAASYNVVCSIYTLDALF